MNEYKFFCKKPNETVRQMVKEYQDWHNGGNNQTECKRHDEAHEYTEDCEIIKISYSTFCFLLDDENFKFSD